jgi:hypothetical protein
MAVLPPRPARRRRPNRQLPPPAAGVATAPPHRPTLPEPPPPLVHRPPAIPPSKPPSGRRDPTPLTLTITGEQILSSPTRTLHPETLSSRPRLRRRRRGEPRRPRLWLGLGLTSVGASRPAASSPSSARSDATAAMSQPKVEDDSHSLSSLLGPAQHNPHAY